MIQTIEPGDWQQLDAEQLEIALEIWVRPLIVDDRENLTLMKIKGRIYQLPILNIGELLEFLIVHNKISSISVLNQKCSVNGLEYTDHLIVPLWDLTKKALAEMAEQLNFYPKRKNK